MTEQLRLDASAAAARLADGAVLLDVREDDEWAAGHAPQARHVPLGHLAELLRTLSPDGVFVVVCRSGSRSARAQAELAQGGLKAINLDGGMRAWSDAGLPVVRDDGSPGSVI